MLDHFGWPLGIGDAANQTPSIDGDPITLLISESWEPAALTSDIRYTVNMCVISVLMGVNG